MSTSFAIDPWGSDGPVTRDSTPSSESTTVVDVVVRVAVRRQELDVLGAGVQRGLRALGDSDLDLSAESARVIPVGAAETAVPQPRATANRTVDHAELRILVSSRLVFRGGREIPLTRLEFDLLLHLCRHSGRVHNRVELLRWVWGVNEAISTRTVDVHIRRLRRKLGTDAAWISTVRSIGYRFDGAESLSIEH